MNKTVKIFLVITIICCFGCTKRESSNNQITNDKVELVFYNLFDEKDSLQGQIQAFQTKYPNIKIKYEKYVDPISYEDLVINEIAEGNGPDIFAIHNTLIDKHKNKLVPMPLDIPLAMSPQKFSQTFFDVAYNDLIRDNRIYGLPLSIDTLALYYNKEYLSSAITGLNKPGRTWETIKKQVIALTKPDKSKERFKVAGISMGRSDNIIQAIDILYLLFLQYGTKIYNDKTEPIFAQKQGTLEGTGKAYYPGLLALELYTSFGLPSFGHYSWNEEITGDDPEYKEINVFTKGKVSMIFGYSYLYDDIKRYINTLQKTGKTHIELKNVQITEVPQVLDPLESNKLYAYASYYPLVVSKNSKYPKEAWLFIQFLTSKDNLQTYHEKTNKPTSRLDLQEEQSLDPIYGAFARQAQYAKSIKVSDETFYNTVFSKSIEDVLDTISIRSALLKAENRIKCFIYKTQKKSEYKDKDCLK